MTSKMSAEKVYFNFWHVQKKKWKKQLMLIDPKCSIKELKSMWLETNGIDLTPKTFPYSFVYNGILLEDNSTLAGK